MFSGDLASKKLGQEVNYPILLITGKPHCSALCAFGTDKLETVQTNVMGIGRGLH